MGCAGRCRVARSTADGQSVGGALRSVCAGFLGGFSMRGTLFLTLLLAVGAAWADDPPRGPRLMVKPEAFKSVDHPDCSHCVVEANRRKRELRADDRVLCWRQVFCDGYTNDGAIPLRFFLNKPYRILNDGWGVFVHDPDAGYAR